MCGKLQLCNSSRNPNPKNKITPLSLSGFGRSSHKYWCCAASIKRGVAALVEHRAYFPSRFLSLRFSSFLFSFLSRLSFRFVCSLLVVCERQRQAATGNRTRGERSFFSSSAVCVWVCGIKRQRAGNKKDEFQESYSWDEAAHILSEYADEGHAS